MAVVLDPFNLWVEREKREKRMGRKNEETNGHHLREWSKKSGKPPQSSKPHSRWASCRPPSKRRGS